MTRFLSLGKKKQSAVAHGEAHLLRNRLPTLSSIPYFSFVIYSSPCHIYNYIIYCSSQE